MEVRGGCWRRARRVRTRERGVSLAVHGPSRVRRAWWRVCGRSRAVPRRAAKGARSGRSVQRPTRECALLSKFIGAGGVVFGMGGWKDLLCEDRSRGWMRVWPSSRRKCAGSRCLGRRTCGGAQCAACVVEPRTSLRVSGAFCDAYFGHLRAKRMVDDIPGGDNSKGSASAWPCNKFSGLQNAKVSSRVVFLGRGGSRE